jgi:small-conductance mechanosensitive channel
MKTIHYLFEHNSLEQVVSAFALAGVVLCILLFARKTIVLRLQLISQQTDTIWDDILADVLASTKLPFMLWLSVMAGLTQIDVPETLAQLPYKAMMLLLILQAGIWASSAMESWFHKRLQASQKAGDGAAITNFGVIAFIVRFLIWIVTLLLLLDNLGVNITTLIASLGIGGVAVALALQNVLGDLFASLSIAMDKPFVIGDFIVVDDLAGTVKHVGLKTTRIQSLSGEELVFSNNDLLKSRIRNYKRMAERRILFGFGVTYDTSPAMLEALAQEVRSLIETQPNTRFDRAHFKSFGASSLDFEVVFYMLEPDYTVYMHTQQAINLALLDYCNREGIQFAFPTQTIHFSQTA